MQTWNFNILFPILPEKVLFVVKNFRPKCITQERSSNILTLLLFVPTYEASKILA